MHYSVSGGVRGGRACFSFCLALVIILTGFALPDSATAQAATTAPSAALLVAADGQFDALVLALEESGTPPLQSFPPTAVIASVDPSASDALEAEGLVAATHRAAIGDADVAAMPAELSFVAAAWNGVVAGPRVDTAIAAAGGMAGDAMGVSDESDLVGFALDPSLYQQSEYMIGKVAVNIVLVESNGAVDTSTEDWTAAERQLTFQQVVAGLAWWQSMEPRAHLQFVYDNHYTTPLPVSYEPVNRSHSDERLWIKEAMQQLGHAQPSYFTSVRYYNRASRDKFGADWAFTVFVVDSTNDGDNHFADGYFAYAYINGPFLVMTSESNGYGAQNLAAVMAHETGHIFGALDEYAGAGIPATTISGYLGVPNGNSAYGGNPSVDSIMKGGTTAYEHRLISTYAAGQVGWRDSDGDGILDPVDTTVTATATATPTEAGVTLTGTAIEAPWPSTTRNPLSINVVAAAHYRVNGGPWHGMTADDGAFDSGSESFTATLPPVPDGSWAIEVRAQNSVGNSDTKTLTLIGSAGVAATLTDVTAIATTTGNGVVDVTGTVTALDGTTKVTAIEYRIDSGAWQSATAADGNLDSATEAFTLSISDLTTGTHGFEVRAWTASPWTQAQVWQQNLAVENTQIIPQDSHVFVPLIADV